MRSKLFATILIVCLSSFGVLVFLPLRSDLGLSFAQSEEPNLMVLTPSFQFNVLKLPSGLLALDKTVSAGGPSYTTQFHLYISDSGNHVIRDFNASTGGLSTVTGTPGTTGYTNGPLVSALFNYPTGLSGENTTSAVVNGCDHWYYPPYGHCCPGCDQPHVDRYNAQEIYVNDSQNFVIRRICLGDPQAAIADCVGQMGEVVTACGNHQKGYVNGDGASACFGSLAGLTAGSAGISYIADAENHVIRSWDGTNVYTIAGTGQPGFVDGSSAVAKFMVPGKTTQDAAGYTYVADIGNNAIRRIDGGSNVITSAGAGPLGQGFVNGQGSQAKFYRPTSIVFNPADNMMYIADSHNNVIRRMDSSGNVTTYAGTGTPGLMNGSLSEAQFDKPVDLVIHNGFMYISDSMNNVIRRIDMVNGIVTTYIS
ncbi:MAG TPA: hypothetical protein VIF64_08275 [Pyrinomonadaceae bacterium]|jgi:hypothetical protein